MYVHEDISKRTADNMQNVYLVNSCISGIATFSKTFLPLKNYAFHSQFTSLLALYVVYIEYNIAEIKVFLCSDT